MAALPYMPLYIADYMADAAHLSTIEHGAYLLLIMTYWQRGEPLPSDDKRLSRIARMTPDEWTEARDTIAEFFDDDGTHWRQKRIDAELDIALNTTRPSASDWKKLRQIVFERDGMVCSYCGSIQGGFEVDHIVPISRGGGNDLLNLCVSCRSCNRSKKDKTLTEWRRN